MKFKYGKTNVKVAKYNTQVISKVTYSKFSKFRFKALGW